MKAYAKTVTLAFCHISVTVQKLFLQHNAGSQSSNQENLKWDLTPNDH